MAADEPYMMAKNYPEVVVITGKKREQSLSLARDKYGATVAILDDGYQYKKLARDVNILLLDHKRPISTGFPFPFGYLREFPFAINRSDIIIFTRAKNDNIPDNVKGFINKQSIYFSDTVFHRVAIKNEFVELSYIKGTKVCAYSGIARNEVFYNTLIDAGLDVVFFAGFHDHSLLEEKTINGILTQGKNKGASIFITTEKDEEPHKSFQRIVFLSGRRHRQSLRLKGSILTVETPQDSLKVIADSMASSRETLQKM